MPYRLPPKVAGLVPYDPVEGQYRIRLDANESFFLPTEEDREKMTAAAAAVALNRYPDHTAAALCEAFAGLYNINPELVCAGNGSDELLFILFSAFLQRGEAVLTLAPDFSMYEFYARQAEANCISLEKGDNFTPDVDSILDSVHKNNVRIVVFSNPCNPTSVGLCREEVRRLVKGTDALVILDEAYMDFWDQSLLSEVAEYDNLIILRTASKALGMAALRVGFSVANRTLTKCIRAAKSPYNVGAVTQAMAAVALRNPMYLSEYLPLILTSRDMLVGGLRDIGLKVYESRTNFAFVKLEKARDTFELLRERGIVVRCFKDRFLRITAGTQFENTELLKHLDYVYKHVL